VSDGQVVKPTVWLHPATSVTVHRADKVTGHSSGDQQFDSWWDQLIFLSSKIPDRPDIQTKGGTLTPGVKWSKPAGQKLGTDGAIPLLPLYDSIA
jgi:hypothetical protein